MRLSRIVIKNFRRIDFADISFQPTSFVIGQNNIGKSSVIKAIEALLTLTKETVKLEDFRILQDGTRSDCIEICGYFSGIDQETANSKGFRGRVINGVYMYKKTYLINTTTPRITTFEHEYTVAEDFRGITTWNQLTDKLGISENELSIILNARIPARGNALPMRWETSIDGAVIWDFQSIPKEVDNPGGASSIVVSKLPRLVHIPSYTEVNEIGKADGEKTLLGKCLHILFEDLISQNPVSATIQESLDLLQTQIDDTVVNGLANEVNRIIADVFPECGIRINPSLNGLSTVLKPQYTVELFSNVHTDADRQGTGLVRTGLFSMLRFHSRLVRTGVQTRPLIVAFEEPEMYLHPAAANLLRDTIYELGESDQIVCTTHSPWMIDLNKDWQSLTKMVIQNDGYTSAINYGINEAMRQIHGHEREQLKMIKTFDDELSRVFFTERCVIVEGDSELIALKNTIKHLPTATYKSLISKTQIVKARGKGAIIPLVKYLNALSIPLYVIHDRDAGTPGAAVQNQPIADAVGDMNRISQLEECLEQCIGYPIPSSDKPYKAFVKTSEWTSWIDIPEAWKNVVMRAFDLTEHQNM